MNKDLFDILYETYNSTIDDIISSTSQIKTDTFSHSIKLSGCMMNFVDYLRDMPIEKMSKKIKHKNRKLFANYIRDLTFTQYDKLIIMCWWHDIGKIKVEKNILAKPAKLTPEEYEEMSKHSIYSAELMKQMGFDLDIISSVFFHHPKNFEEKEIYKLLPAISLLEICDIYTALREPRIYRNELNFEEAIEILKEEIKKGFGNPFLDLFIEFAKCNETLGNDIFARYYGTTVEDIITKSMHYIKEADVSTLPKIKA